MVIAVALLETLGSVALVATAIFLLVLAHKARLKPPAANPEQEARGLVEAAEIVAGMALPAVLSCWGLWKGRRWGWWLATFINAVGLTIFLWDPITSHARPDADELTFIAMFAVLLLLLFLGPVRRFYLRKDKNPPEAGSASLTAEP